MLTMVATMIRLLLVLLCFFCYSVSASCSEGTASCVEGTCRAGKCQCNPSYTGDDCSIPYQICEDGERHCFNGSECLRNNERDPVTKKYTYKCDCSAAFGVSAFAGTQCEYSSTAVCETNTLASESAFCTNSGVCVKMVQRGAKHEGCECPPEFEGLHCQYRKGEAPPEELELDAFEQGEGESDLSGFAMFFILLVAITMAVMLFVGYRKHKTGKEKMAAAVASNNELSNPTMAVSEMVDIPVTPKQELV